MRRTLAERYRVKVDQRGPNECWPWTAYLNARGYGVIGLPGSRRTALAHRVGWQLKNGLIPEGLGVCHHCDSPPCQNPAHWFLGTHQENMTDMMTKGRHRAISGAYWRTVHRESRKGEKNGRAKLTAEAVLQIRTGVKDGEPKAVLARRYGVTYQMVGRIARRQAWAHLG